MWFVAGEEMGKLWLGKKWESYGWTGAGWHNCSKLLELGREVVGQFCVVVLIDKIKRDRVYKGDSQGIQLHKNISDFEVLPGYAGRKCAETGSILPRDRAQLCNS